MKIGFSRFGIWFLLVLVAPLAFAQFPVVEWTAVDWAPNSPVTGASQRQGASGEDWWYSHKNVLDDNGTHIGYIACGYSKWIGYAFEQPGGCWTCSYEREPDWCRFEKPGRTDACARQTIAYYGLDGKMIWCEPYSFGNNFNIIQTTDGGFLAVGYAEGTNGYAGSIDRGSLLYNPALGGNGSLEGAIFPCNAETYQDENIQSHLNATKITSTGQVEWSYLYGFEDVAAQGSEAEAERIAKTFSQGYDLIETPFGYRLVGTARDDATEQEVNRSFLADIDFEGMLLQKKTWGVAGKKSKAIAIDADNTGTQHVIVGYMEGGDRQFAEKRMGYLRLLDVQASDISPVWTPADVFYASEADFTEFERHTSGYDVAFDNQNDIVVAAVENCHRCDVNAADNADGEGVAIKYNLAGEELGKVSIGKVNAFDLKVGITKTMDGGFALVSSTSRLHPEPGYDDLVDRTLSDEWTIQDYLNWTSNPKPWDRTISGWLSEPSFNPACSEFWWSYWNSDALVAKFDANMEEEWEYIFDVEPSRRRGIYPGDLRLSECVYQITQTPDAGFLISGNTSFNLDDDYLVKLGIGPDRPTVIAEPELKIYPNPSSEVVNVSVQIPDFIAGEAVYIYLYNIYGDRLGNKSIADLDEQAQVAFNVSALVPGIYLIRVVAGPYTLSCSVVVK